MLLAGLDTVAGMMGFFMWHLALNPQHRRALVDDPAKIPGAVEELLRRYAISTQTRTLRKDAEYDGMQLKTGDLIVAPTALYNLDERIIADPRKVDLERKVRNATFGGGVHRCAGANLARAELRILIEEWLPRIPDFELDPGGKPVIAGAAVAVLAELPLTWRPRS
jgi:cytochrome P450